LPIPYDPAFSALHPEPLLTLSTAPSAFASLGLSKLTLEALARAGFQAPTPIQAKAIPPALEGRDVIGCAATGTGKTAAFLLPLIERLVEDPTARALVLAPTRELALQIQDALRSFAPNGRVQGVTVIGGESMDRQVRELRAGWSLIVATPGRLCDHIEQKTVRLEGTSFLVLDEADRMLDMGFRRQLDRVLARLPKKRQTMLFSATMAGEVAQFAKQCLVDPVRVEVARSGTVVKGVSQVVYSVIEADKPALLMSLLARDEDTTLVFTRTQHRADKLAKTLSRHGIEVARIHGGRSQSQRKHALEGFKRGDYRVLVATDVAARGIDVHAIGHVVCYDVSLVAEDHVHRVGRTARNEAVGRASTLASPEERSLVRDIERLTRAELPRAETPSDLGELRQTIEQARIAAMRAHGPRRPGQGQAQGHSQGREMAAGRSFQGSSSGGGRRGPGDRSFRGTGRPSGGSSSSSSRGRSRPSGSSRRAR
jgi:ATP-dependent RNA helicase RhlE